MAYPSKPTGGVSFAGLRASKDFGTNEEPEDFRKMINWVAPGGDATFLGLLGYATGGGGNAGRIGKEVTTSRTFHWWSESMNVVRLQLNGALATTDTTVVVDSADPTSSTLGAAYGTALNLVPGDILMVEPTADNSTFNPEYLVVSSVTNATTFVVARAGGGGATAAPVADDRYLIKIGNSHGESTDFPSSTSRNPIEYSNEVQDFETSYSVTDVMLATDYRTGDPLENEKKRTVWDHSRALELSFLFGKKSTGSDANGKPISTTNGFRAQLSSSVVNIFATTPTVDLFMDYLEPSFRFRTERSGDTRVALVGNAALIAINKMIKADTDGSVTFDSAPVTAYGMNFRRLITPFGDVMIKTHPLMTMLPLYSKAMFVMDFSALRYRYLKGLDTYAENDLQGTAKGKKVKTGAWRTVAGLEVWHGGLSCGYIGNITYP